ncbi:rhodanese-like domain-containing protein [Bacillus sp. 3255]|uniref:rhodanese-like domain-containing protein n=1 Tax=Bacillus sp. 3255 TaxID=2817904 RepID=UPI00285FD62C|nr:rhodanese-like domain-containing protein [Bacillus sp. 3255]MDR6884200.1 rhodanese-related sulfurtransferase [Bacillus sp. 3255]
MDSSNWGLIIIIVLISLFFFVRLAPLKGLKNLNANDFQKAIESSSNKILIDVREKTEFKNGYIPNAVNIPLSELKGRINDIPKNKDVFLYCQSGMRSKQAASILKKNGFAELNQLQGGILSWRGKIKK